MSTQPATQLDARALSLLEQYRSVRSATDRLTAALTPEDQMVQSCLEASPAKWHRAHTTWFFETFILAPHAPGYREFDARFRYLYNSYYNNVGERPDRTTRGFFSRPSADEVSGYRAHVDGHMEALLAGDPLPGDLLDKVELGLHHEQQHQELIVTDIKHAFWSNPLRPAYVEGREAGSHAAPPLRWFDFDGGIVDIGCAGAGFAFDNESPRHQVLLRQYRLGSRLVTNAEYLEFIADGGYRTPTLWLSDGWDAVRLNHWRAPLYWEQRDGEWQQFTCSGMRALAPGEPVCHVSYFEADAYARWRGVRLPTEFEWERAAAPVGPAGNFLESERLHPNAAREKEDLPAQMFGDVWEWTSSAYTPYPGFRPATGALGEYNGKFMCNQYVLRGGSCATPRLHIRPSYRNFFPAQARWQFMGIRLAADAAPHSGQGSRNGR
jgi:ergothioneine biosynthesis protein EgtB